MPEQAIELFKKGVKLRLFENHWNSAAFYALKQLHNVSETECKAILDSEISQLATRISEFCTLDFGKEEKSLCEILAHIKETHPAVLSDVIPLLDYEKMKEEKSRMLKDGRCDRRCKKQFQRMIDILIEFSDEPYVDELNSLKTLK